MACAFSLCACGDGSVSPDEIEDGGHYVGEKDPKTGKVELREESLKEAAQRKFGEAAGEEIVDKLNPF